MDDVENILEKRSIFGWRSWRPSCCGRPLAGHWYLIDPARSLAWFFGRLFKIGKMLTPETLFEGLFCFCCHRVLPSVPALPEASCAQKYDPVLPATLSTNHACLRFFDAELLFEGKNASRKTLNEHEWTMIHDDELCHHCDHSWMEVSRLAMVPNCGADDLWVNPTRHWDMLRVFFSANGWKENYSDP